MADKPRRSVVWFFVTAYAVTWLLQLPAVLALRGVIAGPPERFMGLVGLGAFGPMVAAMLASRGAIGALFRPIRTWRVGTRWYVIALLLPGGIFVCAMAVYTLCGGSHGGPWLYLPTDAPHVLAMLVFPIGEEVGWRGFALPRLQERHSPLRASLIIGMAWAFWHVPMFMLAGIPLGLMAIMVPFFMAGSIVFTWIYNRTSASLLLAILTHMGVHLENSHRALPSNITPLVVHTVGYVVVAAAIVLHDRTTWSSSSA